MTIHVAKERFRDKRFAFDGIRIKPGEYAAATGEALLMTVLGSCVAVCLTDSHAGVIGMNHFLLPIQAGISLGSGTKQDTKLINTQGTGLPRGQDSGLVSPNARYGAHAIELLINACLNLGAQKKYLQASVFGGASVLNTVSDIGASNIDFALRYLSQERIGVIRTEVGGRLPQKVLLSGPGALFEVSYLNALRRVVGADCKAIAAASADLQVSQRTQRIEVFAS